MMKNIFLVLAIMLTLIGCNGEDGVPGQNGANGSDANVSFSSDINNTVTVTVTLEELTKDENITNEFNLTNALAIIPRVTIPYQGGDFDISFIPTKNNSLILKENAIMITKSKDGNVVDSEWANILYDVIHDIYRIDGTIHYDYNYNESNETSLIEAIYFTNGKTNIFQTVIVTQQANNASPIEVIYKLDVAVTDGNYTVTQDENGTVTLTQN